MSDDRERRKKFWDDEEETSTGLKSIPKPGAPAPGPQGTGDLDRKMDEIRVLMDQTHQLYQQYFSGVERRTPIEKVRLLESKVAELQRISTTVTAARFKVSQFLSQYKTMKELWERKLREKERK